MSNYSQITAFTPKDSLTTGNPAKIIKGADFDAEFASISTAIASKIDSTTLDQVNNTSDATKNAAVATLTNKTINLNANTLTGTTAEFNTALSDGSFATLDGTETLTNKTLTNPVYTGTLTGGTGVVNIGSGQIYKAADGRVGIGTTSPTTGFVASVNGDLWQGNGAGTEIGRIINAAGWYTVEGSSNVSGVTIAHPNTVRFATASTERARIDASGNFGLGVTPSAWTTAINVKALQFGGGSVYSYSNDRLFVGQNVAITGAGSDTYINTAAASTYRQYQGIHTWYTAPSGTAGNALSFTQAMTLDASGNLLVGTTSSVARFVSYGSGSTGATYCAAFLNSGGFALLDVRNDGLISTGTRGGSPYNNTTASASNLFVDSSGILYRSTSSIKYKREVETLEDSFADRVLDLRPVWYRSTSPADNQSFSYYGFIAEEAAKVDPRFVHWKFPVKTVEVAPAKEAVEAVFDEFGTEIAPACPAQEAVVTTEVDYTGTPEAEGFQYERIVVPLVSIVKRQKAKMESMQAQLDTQNTAMQLLADRLAALESK